MNRSSASPRPGWPRTAVRWLSRQTVIPPIHRVPSLALRHGLFLACLLAASSTPAWAADAPPEKYPAQTEDPEVVNDFAKSNPGYKKRAGEFYEKEYLEDAVERLGRTAEFTAPDRAVAKAILRAFIYDWLDSTVRGNGQVPAEDLAKHLKRLDERFKSELNGAQYPKYLRWRNDRTGARNTLAFLMFPPPAEPAPAGAANPQVKPDHEPAAETRILTLHGLQLPAASGGNWPVAALLTVAASKFNEVKAQEKELTAFISKRLTGFGKSDLEVAEKRKALEADLMAFVNQFFKGKPVQALRLNLDL
jgi:hypothetical protein